MAATAVEVDASEADDPIPVDGHQRARLVVRLRPPTPAAGALRSSPIGTSVPIQRPSAATASNTAMKPSASLGSIGRTITSASEHARSPAPETCRKRALSAGPRRIEIRLPAVGAGRSCVRQWESPGQQHGVDRTSAIPVSSMLTESMPTIAAPRSPADGPRRVRERGPGRQRWSERQCWDQPVCTSTALPWRSIPANTSRMIRRPCLPFASINTPDGGDSSELAAGEVITVCKPVERSVEIRSGIRYHVDAADVEFRAFA